MSRNLFSIRMYLALMIIATSLLGTSVLAQGAAVVRVDPSTSLAQVNDRVNLPIKIENVASVTAFEIHLSFDPAVLEVVEVTNGGFIAPDFPVQNVFDNTAGTIDYAVAQLNRAAAQGSGTLLTIVFRAKANGSSTVNLRSIPTAAGGLLLADENGASVQASWVSGAVTVGSGTTAAAPTVTPLAATSVTPAPVTATLTPTVAAPQTAAVVRIDPASISVNANDAFNILVKVDNATNLSAFEMHLSFDANQLEVTRLINGGFLAADIVAQNTFSNTAGTIDYAISQNVRPASQGSGTLLTIVFRAKSAGTSSIVSRSVTTAPDGLLLSDSNGRVLPDTWASGSVKVNSTSTPTPTPATTSRIHVVRFGEWLYCIGRAYAVDPMAIARTNGITWWPYIIFPGQQLTIPYDAWVDMPASGTICQPQFSVLPAATATAVPVTSTPATVVPTAIVATVYPLTATPVPSSACRVVHVVRSGETLYRIGILYGISYTEIARVNQISNAWLIYAGQQLCIP